MNPHLTRLALLQLATLIFGILISTVMLKLRFGSSSNFPILATYVRDYGFLMAVIPIIWIFWATYRANHPSHSKANSLPLVSSGVAIVVIFLLLGIAGFGTATVHRSMNFLR